VLCDFKGDGTRYLALYGAISHGGGQEFVYFLVGGVFFGKVFLAHGDCSGVLHHFTTQRFNTIFLSNQPEDGELKCTAGLRAP
jgi:hypothetical protein